MSSLQFFLRTRGRYVWAVVLLVAVAATFLPFMALPGTLTLTAFLGAQLGPGMSFYSLANTLGTIMSNAAVLGVDPGMTPIAVGLGWVVCVLWVAVVVVLAYHALCLLRDKPYKFAPVLAAHIVALVSSLLFLVLPGVANGAFGSILGATFSSDNVSVEIFDWTPWQLIVFLVTVCSIVALFVSRKMAKGQTEADTAALRAEIDRRAEAKAAAREARKREKAEKRASREANRKPNWKRKRAAIWGGVAAVVVVAAVGFNAWHQTPQFCNSVCHSPMDRYVTSYVSGDSDLLVTAHAGAGVNCVQCHDDGVDTQVRELSQWVTGDFSDPIGVTKIGTREFCLRCHDDGNAANGKDWDGIVVATANYGGDEGVNPHSSHNGLQECGTCHSSHGVSVVGCNTCHDLEVPEGWAGSIEEASQIQVTKGLPA